MHSLYLRIVYITFATIPVLDVFTVALVVVVGEYY
jgi:hypothetical protein